VPDERSSLGSPSSNRLTTPTEGSPVVRIATTRDQDELGALFAVAAIEIEDRRGSSFRLGSLPNEPAQLLAHLLNDSAFSVLVAEDAAALCGFAILSLQPPQLLAIYVAAIERRKGIARALLGAAATRAEQQGSGVLTALAAAGDRAEKSFYEALGYRAELLVMAPRVRPSVVDQHHE
jgi:GNAT superfamily N-acetyltransferase